jgi:hypothetical protein
MAPTYAARPATAETVNGPRKMDRRGGTIDITDSTGEKLCNRCGAELPDQGRRRPRRFCSDRCRKAFSRNGHGESHPGNYTRAPNWLFKPFIGRNNPNEYDCVRPPQARAGPAVRRRKDFIVENDLVWIENLITGARTGEAAGVCLSNKSHPDHNKPYAQSYIRQFGARKVEGEALVKVPAAGRRLCRDAILKYVETDAAEQYEEDLAEAREQVRQAVLRLLSEESAP